MASHKSMRQLLSDFREAKRKTEAVVENLPRIIGLEGVRIVKENFDLQGYDTGDSFSPWQKRAQVTDQSYDYNRKPNAFSLRSKGKGRGVFLTPSGRRSKAKNRYKGSVYSSDNKLLLQRRVLYNGIRSYVNGKKVRIGVDLNLIVYAQKMNEGGKGKWGKYAATNTPARQFMPRPGQIPNRKILIAVRRKIEYEQYQAMKVFRKAS